MTDPRIEKLAGLLVNYSTEVQPGDRVAIFSDTLAQPLIKATYAEVLKAGGHPLPVVGFLGMNELLLRYGSTEQLQHIPKPLALIYDTYDVIVTIWVEENTRGTSNADPTKMALLSQRTHELMGGQMQRTAKGDCRWSVVLFPTNAFAQDAEMSLMDYEDFVYGACMPDTDDPVGYWQRFSSWQGRLAGWLSDKERVRVLGPDTDLRFSIVGRVFDNEDGHWNMPGGETGTGPVEDSVEGYIRFSYPSNYMGHEVTGVALEFENGKVVRATAKKGEDFLLAMLDTDEGARRVGEFAIGTNEGIQRFTGNILFDEKMQGTVHLALGAGYPWTGSQNTSAIHWDMIYDLRDEGEIYVDGELLHKNGKFVIEF